jgi:hypothetical protein
MSEGKEPTEVPIFGKVYGRGSSVLLARGRKQVVFQSDSIV